MITAFTVRNFKAIGDEPVRIELKPITLLFGANSTGKSSILDVLNYAYEVFKHNIDAKKTALGGNSLDLGGFERFVHSHKIKNSVFLRFELDFKVDPIFINQKPKDSLESYISNRLVNLLKNKKISKSYVLEIKDILSKVDNAYVEIEICYSFDRGYPYIIRYEVGMDNESLITIKYDINTKTSIISSLNTRHPIFVNCWIKNGIIIDDLIKILLKEDFYTIEVVSQENDTIIDIINTKKDRQKIFNQLGKVPVSSSNTILSTSDNLNLKLRYSNDYGALPRWNVDFSFDSAFKDNISDPLLPIKFVEFINYILTEPGRRIFEWLSRVRYLGPLREIPSRHFDGIQQKSMKIGSWATGLAAWDVLYSLGQQQLISDQNQSEESIKSASFAKKTFDDINDWLANPKKLNTGYRIIIERYRELPSEQLIDWINKYRSDHSEIINCIFKLQEKFRIWLKDESNKNVDKDESKLKFTPHEIGVGISQVLPVVIAAFGINAPLISIEQPELHIHPAIQVQLGDLFIERSKHNIRTRFYKDKPRPQMFLIETHSEHLLLRLLRRINETYEGRLPPDFNAFTADDVAIYYLEKKPQGLCIRRLEISEDGDSKGEWPEGFFEERRAELF